MSLSAIILDFDGVIVDTEKLHLRAFQDVLGARGIDLSPQDYFDDYLGLDDAGVLRALARQSGLDLGDARVSEMLAEKAARYGDLIAGGGLLFEGVGQRLREWSRTVPLGIASGAIASEIERILRRESLLECFTAIVSAGDVQRGKPAPDPYLVALGRLNAARRARLPDGPPIEPRRVVAIEDSLPGIEAARAAGMRTAAVTTNHAAAQLSAADLVVASAAALDLPMLERLTS